MKRVLLTLSMLSIFFPAVSAFAVDGTLSVKSGSLRVKRDDGFKVSFYEGNYRAELNFADRKAYLTVHRNDIRTDATLDFPAGASIPENGVIDLDGFKTGQTFKINGSIRTIKDETPTQRESEACTYYERRWVCEGYGRRRHCYWENVPVQGYRTVEFYYLTKTSTLDLSLNSNTGGPVDFDGRSVSRKKIYTYEGVCY